MPRKPGGHKEMKDIARREARRAGRVAANRVWEPGDCKVSWRSAPSDGWLHTDGAEYLIEDYPELYAAIGTAHGGDGVTTFRVPDTRGRVIVGAGAGPGLTARNVGETFGAEERGGLVGTMATHRHILHYARSTTTATGGSASRVQNIALDLAEVASTTNEGGGEPMNIVQPSGVANWFIKT